MWCQEFSPPVSWLGRWVLEPYWIRRLRGARVVAVSPSSQALLLAHGVAVEAVIAPGIAALPKVDRRGVSPTPRVVFLGRLVASKGPLEAMTAFSRIRAALPGATLDILGDGYLVSTVRRNIVPGVAVHGFVSESKKAEILARADILLMPSHLEGWGIVAVEAAAFGVPVIAYRVPGLRDAVIDGVTGLLTDANPDALAEAAVSLLGDPERWLRTSLAAVAWAHGYTWGSVAKRWRSILERPSRASAYIDPLAARDDVGIA
ncbi:MAG: glycosyltransferase family 4 protein [Candidatus Dormibacteraeota bacterium]|nr:glycosyltransferase family 4 protein [Candidatus Dormibacteraeota bacterium]